MGFYGKSRLNNDTKVAHKETLRKNLEHRLSVARSKGDDKLIEQLQQEANYLNIN